MLQGLAAERYSDGQVVRAEVFARGPFCFIGLWYVVYYQAMGFIFYLHMRIFGVRLRFAAGAVDPCFSKMTSSQPVHLLTHQICHNLCCVS